MRRRLLAPFSVNFNFDAPVKVLWWEGGGVLKKVNCEIPEIEM